jgi:hypothetical protein
MMSEKIINLKRNSKYNKKEPSQALFLLPTNFWF